MKKLNVAVLFGGRSAEHEISLLSARNVIKSLDPQKYNPVLVGIGREGRWYLNSGSLHLLDEEDVGHVRLMDLGTEVGLLPTGPSSSLVGGDARSIEKIDVLFPVLHGPYGEDGTVQGLAKLADIPCVGAGVLGSAVGMDKDVMKRLLRDAGIPVAPFRIVHAARPDEFSYPQIAEALGEPVYVKPANMGSSVGISRVSDAAGYQAAITEALQYDRKVVVEQQVTGREIECSILGNDEPVASVAGEVVPEDGFYSYDAKYANESGAKLMIPAQLTEAELRTVQETAKKAFQVLCCEGMARVDGFLTNEGAFVINEINTIPGFTRISMYPKLFEASGISQTSLIDRLIELAIERHERERGLKLTP